MWFGLVVYNLATLIMRNPLYGFIFIRTTKSIKDNLKKNKLEYEKFLWATKTIKLIHTITMATFSHFLMVDYLMGIR